MTGLELRLFAAQIYKLFPEPVTVVRISAHLTVVPNRLVKAPLTEVRRRHIRHQTRRFRRVW